CEALEAGLAARGYKVDFRTSAGEALEALTGAEYDVGLTDLNMKGIGGIELCERIVVNRPDVPVVVLTAFGSFDSAVAAIRAGAYDFIRKPEKLDVLGIALRHVAQHKALVEEVKLLQTEVAAAGSSSGSLVGKSA